jgi:hypothetical protein
MHAYSTKCLNVEDQTISPRCQCFLPPPYGSHFIFTTPIIYESFNDSWPSFHFIISHILSHLSWIEEYKWRFLLVSKKNWEDSIHIYISIQTYSIIFSVHLNTQSIVLVIIVDKWIFFLSRLSHSHSFFSHSFFIILSSLQLIRKRVWKKYKSFSCSRFVSLSVFLCSSTLITFLIIFVYTRASQFNRRTPLSVNIEIEILMVLNYHDRFARLFFVSSFFMLVWIESALRIFYIPLVIDQPMHFVYTNEEIPITLYL